MKDPETTPHISPKLTGRKYSSVQEMNKMNRGYLSPGKRCPRCGALLLTNLEGDQWCSFLNCDYGMDEDSAREGDWIQTFSGIRFWPMDPRPEEVCIEDIAHGLSLTCRYSGQCERFYSVAEHSLVCADHVPDHLRLVALLHDASEAYISDLCQPVKRFIPQYKEIEARIMTAVEKRFGILTEEWKSVKEIDVRVLATEAMQVLRGGPQGWAWNPAEHALPCVRLNWLPPEHAKARFLYAFKMYAEMRGLEVEA